MAQKNETKDVKGLVSVELTKAISSESKSVMGAIKTWIRILSESKQDEAENALYEIKRMARAQFGNNKIDSMRKIILEIVKRSAKYQLTDGTLCMQFTKQYSYSQDGQHVAIDLFKGFKAKSTYSVSFISECWNRFLNGVAVVNVDKKYMTSDEILVKYVEECEKRGLEVSEETQLVYDSLQATLAEAV